MKMEQFQLKNGLNVFLVPRPEATSLAVNLMVRAGSKHEERGKEGLAHFLEHMAFKGTKKWPTPQSLARFLDSLGAVYNAYTDKERTSYWIKVAPRFWHEGLMVVSQLVTASLLPSKEVEVERGVIIEEINMYQDQPADKVSDLAEEEILGRNRLGRPVIGKKEVILKIKRRDFLDFKKKWYQAPRMSLAVVGGIESLKKVKEAIVNEGLFDSLAGKKRREVLPSPSPSGRIRWCREKTQQSHFHLGVLTFPWGDRRDWAAAVFTTLLGQGFSSRLWREIREKRGWAYYVFARHLQYQSGGFIDIGAGVRNEVVGEAIELIVREIKRIKANLKKSEVERAKRSRIGRYLLKIEDTSFLADTINTTWLMEGKIYRPEEVVRCYERVSFSQVGEIASLVERREISGAVITPIEKVVSETKVR